MTAPDMDLKITELPRGMRTRFANPKDQVANDLNILVWNLCLEVRALTAEVAKLKEV